MEEQALSNKMFLWVCTECTLCRLYLHKAALSDYSNISQSPFLLTKVIVRSKCRNIDCSVVLPFCHCHSPQHLSSALNIYSTVIHHTTSRGFWQMIRSHHSSSWVFCYISYVWSLSFKIHHHFWHIIIRERKMGVVKIMAENSEHYSCCMFVCY